jgi:uncharacterized protein YndB with AHSA1/START domain
MPRVRASRELLAPLDDVWDFVAEPYNLPKWAGCSRIGAGWRPAPAGS